MVLNIYLCAFLKDSYIEEAKICIKSIRKNGKFTGKIYLFTDKNITIEGVIIIKVNCDNVYFAASYRTRLFRHIKDFSPNDIYLYLDTDIVILKPLPSFDYIDDKIHVYEYRDVKQSKKAFAGYITNDNFYTNKNAFSSGILLFRPSVNVKKIFNKIYKLYLKLIETKKVNSCWEQPALCFMFIKHNMYRTSLTKLVYEERTKEKIDPSMIFNHLCGMRSSNRPTIMKKYL